MESIRLVNYQCFADNTFTLKPLTLLSGLSNTGKTALLQSILLLWQSYQGNHPQDRGLILNGPLVRIGSVGDLLRVQADEEAVMEIAATSNQVTYIWRFQTWNHQLDVFPLAQPSQPIATIGQRKLYFLSSCQEGARVDFRVLEAARPGSMILIEHPEFGLHNSAVTAIADRMAQAAARGVQIIVETHSDHVLNGIRVAIHQGRLDCKNFNCLHFAHASGGTIEVQEILWDRRARTHTWPENFFDEWEKSLEELLEKIDE